MGQIFLLTFGFRTPAFYRKHGFEIVTAMDDCPRGHHNLVLRKRLEPLIRASAD